MNNHRRRGLRAAIGAAALGSLPLKAGAQSFPSRPVTIVVPYPPGAASEQVARSVQVRLAAGLGQPVVIESRAGAGGTIGAAYVAKSPADGYRILLATQPIITISPHLQKDMGFDPLKDLTPLTNGVNAVVGIAVSSAVPVQTRRTGTGFPACHRLAGFLADFLADQARQQVDRAARRERRHEPDWFRWTGLGERSRRHERRQRRQTKRKNARESHGCLRVA